MRAFLEFLGIVAPRGSRREPVALPAWIRMAWPLAIVALAVASTLLLVLVRLVLG